MQKIKIPVKIICFCMIFVFCGELFRYLLVDDTASYTRIMMHELYNQNSNIDILFVGSSHCYNSLSPEITDKIFGENTFNAGSSWQELNSSLAIIKEADKKNNIKQIYLELFYDVALRENLVMTKTYILSDYMKPSINKFTYLLNASEKESYVDGFIIARREWEKVFDLNYILELVKKKRMPEYKNYSYTFAATETESYSGKGYVSSDAKVMNGTFWAENDFRSIDVSEVHKGWKKSLFEIIDYCKEKGIELILISAPMPNFRLVNVGNYDDYIDFVNDLIKNAGGGVKYYDFNLCREEYIANDSAIFKDHGHLNRYGAEIFSTVFSNFFTGQISEEELFYDSYKEKIEHLTKDIFGVIVREDKEKCLITIQPVTNADVNEITYRFIKHTESKEEPEFIDAQNLSQVAYQEGEAGTFEIITYLSGEEKSRVIYEYG